MADRRFDLAEALAMVQREAARHAEGLKAESARIEDHLRLAHGGREIDPAALARAEILHVFEVDTRSVGPIQSGSQLELITWGRQIGSSLVAPTIQPGRYRAVLVLTKLEAE